MYPRKWKVCSFSKVLNNNLYKIEIVCTWNPQLFSNVSLPVDLSASTEGASSAVERKTNDNKSLQSLQVETEACTLKQPTISHKENQTDLKNLKAEKIRGTEACTPKPPMTSQNANLTDSKKHQTAKKIASLVKNPSALKPKNHSQLSQAKGKPPSSVRRSIYFYAHS